jgi:hypothetical protein
MKIHTALTRTILSAACFTTPFITFAQAQQLSLKHGVYVQEEISCKGAPNAAIIAWDGTGFAGAHSSKCTSHSVRKDGSHFQVSTTCSALGDGTPNPSGAPYVDSFLLTRLSGSSFEMLKGDQAPATFRWCSVKNP